MGILITILLGALAGWLASKIFKGYGNGLLIDIIVGILGGFIGGNVLGWLGINWGTTILGQIVTAVIGAVILLWVVSLFKKSEKKRNLSFCRLYFKNTTRYCVK